MNNIEIFCMLGVVIIGIIIIVITGNITRYRIVEIKSAYKVKYVIQESCFGLLWKDLWIHNTSFKYDSLDEAIEVLNNLRHRSKVLKRVVKV